MNGYRSYKGYMGVFRVDDEANVIRGKVVNTKDTITFQGQTVAEAVEAFRDSVDDYLDFCESLGQAPEKPFSGRLLVRLRPEDHRALSMVAQIKGVSLNKLVSHSLRKVARRAVHFESTSPTSVTTAKRRAELTAKADTPVKNKSSRSSKRSQKGRSQATKSSK